MPDTVSVLVQTPAHSDVGEALSYLSEFPLSAGTLVRVPLGRRDTLGLVWDPPTNGQENPAPDAHKLRPVGPVLDALPPLNTHWRALVSFAARYYQRSPGEVALAALPPQLRELSPDQLTRRLKKLLRDAPVSPPAQGNPQAPDAQSSGAVTPVLGSAPDLTPEQSQVMAELAVQPGPFLLFGNTGSGKTEVYLQHAQRVMARETNAQVLIMVPEINLTPQLEARFRARFERLHGAQAVVSLHSGMTPAQRLGSWISAHLGIARVVLGTRMAVFASMPHLRLIVVDEEHDPSYKQQEGARYSARDLAVYRGHLEGAQVILGSATPSLESWHHSRKAEEGGRYRRLHMPSRVGPSNAGGIGALPLVRRVDMNHQPRRCVFSPPLLDAIRQRIARGEQSLILLNRRGYAPVLQCTECDWKSDCPHCSAYRVFHKLDRTLRCHHCGHTEPVPRTCPACGNPDLASVGRGTERLEEHLAELLAQHPRPDGQTVRILRIDADSTRLKGTLAAHLAQAHAGDVDVLVGTQMIAKGHDFRRVTLVAAINPDGALFSSDFRAPERLFSLLMQAAGRAGRDAGLSASSEMWIQTFHPQHPLFEALKRHDYPAFAESQLAERLQAGLPPFSFQALVRAEARSQELAQGFLNQAREQATGLAASLGVSVYPAVPMAIQRVANVERAQMVLESPSRGALQRFLGEWHTLLQAARKGPAGKGLIRWAVDVDPLAI